ncbi:hypothetical protein [Curtobacterium luteum]|uniref:hypothetical protein n=1 Tax=Curtobacterium luteum TaxID=33881 RepID=UPI0037FB2831
MTGTIMQKAITPQVSDAFFNGQLERFGGYVIPMAATSGLERIEDLIEVHGLGFPGSPFAPGMPHLDVVRFEATPELFVRPAVGGSDARTAEALGALWVDREPFTGTGFVPNDLDRIVELNWMPSHRVPFGAEIWRYTGDGQETWVARYAGVHIGWVYRDDLQAGRPASQRPISMFGGGIASVGGTKYVADLIDGTHVAIVRLDPSAEQAGFVQTGTGVWATVVPVEDVQEYYELDVRLRWAGLDLRVVDETVAESGEAAVMAMSLQHDYRLNEGLQLVKLDADWYEAMLPKSALASAEFRQTMLPSWPGADTTVA